MTSYICRGPAMSNSPTWPFLSGTCLWWMPLEVDRGFILNAVPQLGRPGTVQHVSSNPPRLSWWQRMQTWDLDLPWLTHLTPSYSMTYPWLAWMVPLSTLTSPRRSANIINQVLTLRMERASKMKMHTEGTVWTKPTRLKHAWSQSIVWTPSWIDPRARKKPLETLMHEWLLTAARTVGAATLVAWNIFVQSIGLELKIIHVNYTWLTVFIIYIYIYIYVCGNMCWLQKPPMHANNSFRSRSMSMQCIAS